MITALNCSRGDTGELRPHQGVGTPPWAGQNRKVVLKNRRLRLPTAGSVIPRARFLLPVQIQTICSLRTTTHCARESIADLANPALTPELLIIGVTTLLDSYLAVALSSSDLGDWQVHRILDTLSKGGMLKSNQLTAALCPNPDRISIRI